ncbi:hypothetical protein N7509_014151 [Penicillium cosmopolitanum]|uniref:Carboxylic ester hydrolase n=1 Tax=Penicillium cosmopolitanum TaxID=1131564 RepID=A0A9W9S1Y1_9EURO|nr:uncharacterized protein N7509_014151 [Penicillium cosmopolitanum]KAJ5369539.1 hypothetical protein N7509_014151 [Penicillium cosmopolitanum]
MRCTTLYASLVTSLVALSEAFSHRSTCTKFNFQHALPKEATVLSTAFVEAGGSYGEGAPDIAYPSNSTYLPELCAVIVNVTTSAISSYRFGLFLPSQWNDRFLAVGNGGFAGGINWLSMGNGVTYGHAVVSTDTGHNSTSLDVSWALDNEEKRKDFGFRAIHGSVVLGKALTEAFYLRDIQYSYYTGSSTGGRQGLKEVQLHADSFDGVLIGAPAWWTSHQQPWTSKVATYNLPVSSPNHIPSDLFAVIANQVVKHCDILDGVVDGIVSSPSECNLESLELACDTETANASACLTAPQLQTLQEIYANYTVDGQLIFPGMELGSEATWSMLLSGDAPSGLGDGYIQNFVLNDPDWTWEQYNDSIVSLAEKIDPGECTAWDYSSLDKFRDRGGKLFLFHGLADGGIVPRSSGVFYERTLALLGGLDAVRDWFRLFYIPGMEHVGDTPVGAPWFISGGSQASRLGSNAWAGRNRLEDPQHDALLALMDWVENGMVIKQVIATTWTNSTDPTSGVLRQRPLCPYPEKQVYIGGNEKVPESWKCV